MSSTSRPPTVFYALAALVATTTLAVWLFTGAHLGWTQTSVAEMQHDEITGIDYPVRRDQFVAGLEVLGAGAAATLLFGATGLVVARRRRAAG